MAAEPSRAARLVATIVLGTVVATTGACGGDCDTEIAVEPVVLHGDGAELVDLSLSARVTAGGAPVRDLVVEFRIGRAPDDGIVLGSTSTDEDGVAHLLVDDGVGPASLRGADAERWTRYRAEVDLFQTSEQAAKSVCGRSAEAAFHFEP